MTKRERERKKKETIFQFVCFVYLGFFKKDSFVKLTKQKKKRKKKYTLFELVIDHTQIDSVTDHTHFASLNDDFS